MACEYSGTVRDAFRALGHQAFSCDVRPTISNSGLHYEMDVRCVIRNDWDLLIAHPPCTHLAVSGARWFKEKAARQAEALEFVRTLMHADIPRIAIENPVSIISTVIRKPDQIVQPWMFGDEFTKTTCLWLKGLPKLQPTNIVGKGEFVIHGGRRLPKWYSNRERDRDRTFTGIAQAMAAQWGELERGLPVARERV